MSDFETAVNFVLRNEGGGSVNPKDKGGVTQYGISLRFLKSLPEESRKKCHIYDQEVNEDTIRALTIQQAKSIYYYEFWLSAPFNKILNQEHCNYIFDMAVNLGISPAIKCVQRACWAVMKRWELLQDDGILGENTLEAIQHCGFLIMPPIRAERANFYRALVDRDPAQKEFIQGWYDRAYNT